MSIFTTYAGRPLLTLPPDLDQQPASKGTTVDTDTFTADFGTEVQKTREAVPNVTTVLDFLCTGRQQMADMEEFLNTVAGRAYSFWIPSWDDDFLPLTIGFLTITIKSIRYTERMFPYPIFRNAYTYRKDDPTSGIASTIGSAVDNGDGTETIGGIITADPTEYRYSFLWLVRLDSDDIELEYHHGELMHVALPIFHVPEG